MGIVRIVTTSKINEGMLGEFNKFVENMVANVCKHEEGWTEVYEYYADKEMTTCIIHAAYINPGLFRKHMEHTLKLADKTVGTVFEPLEIRVSGDIPPDLEQWLKARLGPIVSIYSKRLSVL